MSSDTLISIKNLSKCYKIYSKPQDRLLQMLARSQKKYYQELWALKDVTFEVKKGESFGIIGRNGSGKSTLLQILAGTLDQTSGEVLVNGRIAALLELGSGFNPDFTGRENIFLNGNILGLKKQEIEERYDEIVKFADIGDFIDQPVKTYSSGMFMRLAFAVQAHVDASIVIIDEALTVGDIFFRQKCYSRLEKLRNAGAATLLVTHSMQEIEQFCDRTLLLDQGKALLLGSSSEAVKRYYLLHQSPIPAPGNLDDPAANNKTEAYCEVNQTLSNWADELAFVDAANLTQVTNGAAKCTRFAVCDSTGSQRGSFAQGEMAYFFYEFLVLQPIQVPLGGIVIQNDKGILVHGKGSLEYGKEVPSSIPVNTLIRCQQSIELKLAIGEYTFELGLASINPAIYAKLSRFSNEELFGHITRICHLPQAGMFSIGLRSHSNGSRLTHHGIADLAGNFEFGFEANLEGV